MSMPSQLRKIAQRPTKTSNLGGSGVVQLLLRMDKSRVAGVELATASEPPVGQPRIWGRRRSGLDPSRPKGVTRV